MIRTSAIDPSVDVLDMHCDIWTRLIEAVIYFRIGNAVPESQV
jgi:hypothetical protein